MPDVRRQLEVPVADAVRRPAEPPDVLGDLLGGHGLGASALDDAAAAPHRVVPARR